MFTRTNATKRQYTNRAYRRFRSIRVLSNYEGLFDKLLAVTKGKTSPKLPAAPWNTDQFLAVLPNGDVKFIVTSILEDVSDYDDFDTDHYDDFLDYDKYVYISLYMTPTGWDREPMWSYEW